MTLTSGRLSRPTWRLLAVALLFGIAGVGLAGRLAYLQIYRHAEYAAAAQSTHDAQRDLPAPRGTILDRKGYPLATSVQTFAVMVTEATWRDRERARRTAEQLAPALKRSPGELFAAMHGESGPAVLARDVPYDQGRAVIALGLPGVVAEVTSRRVYPEGGLASSILGFIGQDGAGLAGVELELDATLAGEAGTVRYERDSLGRPIAFGRQRATAPVAGRDIVLTIDRSIQRMAERELDDAIKRTRATGGTIIVQEPGTGAILAMVSRPSFDLVTLDLNAPRPDLYRNRAATDLYEPGSVFKLVTYAAAVEAGKIAPTTVYNDIGKAEVGERVFRNWDLSANGPTTMARAMARSLNTATVWLVTKVIGAELFYKAVRAFGFGRSTESGISGEADGIYRLPSDDNWYPADLASNSFGQAISVTPLQIVNMVSALANGGTLMRPSIVREVHDGDGVETTQPAALGRAVSEETARVVRGMMREVVESNAFARVPGYTAGGKSGTAYVPIGAAEAIKGDAYKDEVTIPSFAGFAPATNPRVSILVKLDNLTKDDFGATLTGPIFSRLAASILAYLRVPPDAPETLPKTATPGVGGR